MVWPDRASLDAQYNLRQAVPSHPEDFARWRRASEQARASLPCRIGLAYGPHPLETLDFFPTATPGRPILVFIHGGYWQAMGKDDFSFVANGFATAAAGNLANVAVIDYPLAPGARMDRIVASVMRALLWLHRQAPALGAAPGRLYAAGHSAGGHLVAMAAVTNWTQLDPKAPASLLQAGLAISGLFDLRPIQLCYLNDVIGMDVAEAERNSPLLLLPAASHRLPPLALVVGEGETEAFHGQQSDFARAYAYAPNGGQVMAVTEPGRHHFDIMHDLGVPDGHVQAGLAALIRAGD